MRLTIFGSAGTRPGAGRACSSYLVESDGYRFLVDCGNGSMANLVAMCDPRTIDAVLLSHRHSDHWADVIPLYYALWLNDGGPSSVDVYGPPGLGDFIGQLLPDDPQFRQLLRFQDVRAGEKLELGPLRMEFFAANHPVETLATRLTDGERVLTYTGDSAPSDEIVRAARDADVLLCDSTWLGPPERLPPNVHMTGAQAGEHASAAGVDRLIVTHVWPELAPADVAAEAAGTFGGRIDEASDRAVFEL